MCVCMRGTQEVFDELAYYQRPEPEAWLPLVSAQSHLPSQMKQKRGTLRIATLEEQEEQHPLP